MRFDFSRLFFNDLKCSYFISIDKDSIMNIGSIMF